MAWQALIAGAAQGENDRYTNLATAIETFKSHRRSYRHNRAQITKLIELTKRQVIQRLRVGALEVERHRAGMRSLEGEQQAGFAASGVDVNTGSAQVVQEQTQHISDIDQQTIQENTRLEVDRMRDEIANYHAQLRLMARQYKQARKMRTASFTSFIFGGGNKSGLSSLTNYFGSRANQAPTTTTTSGTTSGGSSSSGN